MSQHPTDILIRRLITTGGAASPEDIQAIINRMASAPFNTTVQRVPSKLRRLPHNIAVGTRSDSLTIHFIKRVFAESQWSVGTTVADYLRDIQAAILHPEARVLVSQPAWGAPIAATITRMADAVPYHRRGPNALPRVFVVYSADDAKIVTAYMFSSLAKLRLSGETVWLK